MWQNAFEQVLVILIYFILSCVKKTHVWA